MKKSLLFLCLLSFGLESFAFLSQSHWRWRNDNGSETTATWLAGEDVSTTIAASVQRIRLRMQFFNNDSANTEELNGAILKYSADGGVNWVKVETTAGSNHFILAGNGPNVNELDPTTTQLTGRTGFTFRAGKIITSSSALPVDVIPIRIQTEYEWVLSTTASILPNTKYMFYLDATDTSASGYKHPYLLTSSILPIQLLNFNVSKENNAVKLAWSTVNEQNNSHFEIERSSDGFSNWQSISTVKGSGSSNQTNNYLTYDNNSKSGANYYRIKQVDFDGASKISSIKSITVNGMKSVFNIFQNPVKGDINFMLKNYSGKFSIRLFDMTGKIIGMQSFVADNILGNYKFSPSKNIGSGLYILDLKGNDISFSSKVVFQ